MPELNYARKKMHQHNPQIQKSCFVFSGPLFACGWVYSTQNSTQNSTLKPSTQGAAAPFQQHTPCRAPKTAWRTGGTQHRYGFS